MNKKEILSKINFYKNKLRELEFYYQISINDEDNFLPEMQRIHQCIKELEEKLDANI
ncbi:hypothetical protein KJ942_08840 [bacterium]|nr:hypothetical protein [bacterium]MBU4003005.1 hypothetical protein [Pseudomonadota bacterium]